MKIVNGILSDVNIPGVKFVVDIIPKGRKRRPGIAMVPKYITIHNTGCDKVPADNFRRVQLDPNQDKEVSWHFTVDERMIIQHLPITEVAWHAGNRNGNYTSFGIETCERDGAEEVVIKFVAELLKYQNWGVDRVRSHKSWSGKQCPWKILPHWDKFIKNIATLGKEDTELIKAVDLLYKRGIINSPKVWYSVDKFKMEYVPGLIRRMGGIDRLVKDKIITDAFLWERKQYNATHVRSLIIKYSKLG